MTNNNEITEETLKITAKMLFYIMTPFTDFSYWVKCFFKYDGWLKSKPSLRRLLSKHLLNTSLIHYPLFFCLVAASTLTKITTNDNVEDIKEVKQFIFRYLSNKYNIQLQQIQNILESSSILDSKSAHRIINHPVHIIDKSGKLSPSALVPFCHLGNRMGVKMEHFDVPVCDMFEATILNDRLCYEIDPNKFETNVSAKAFRDGMTFYVDINEDRQLYSEDSDFLCLHFHTRGVSKS